MTPGLIRTEMLGVYRWKKLSGYVEHIIYRNTGNGYSVFELVAEGEEVTCVGTFRALDEGENLELTGGYVEHAVYGKPVQGGKL